MILNELPKNMQIFNKKSTFFEYRSFCIADIAEKSIKSVVAFNSIKVVR